MISQERLKEVIGLGVYAPSGDNSQPWHFVVHGNNVDIYNLPDKDNPYYNFNQNGSMVAHGGLIENIIIASGQIGLKAAVYLFPNANDKDFVASLEFKESAPQNNLLFPFIKERVTNRNPYNTNVPLTNEEKMDILSTSSEIDYAGRIKLIEDRESMRIIGEAVSVNEIVALETKMLHNIFFKDIIWSDKDEEDKKSGLYIKTLELPLPVEIIFRLLKYWPIASMLNGFGFAKFAAKGNAKIYASASAIGIVSAPGNSPKDFINAGRLMQRVWLKAAKLGLSLQPVTGILFIMQRIIARQAKDLSEQHISIIKEAYTKLQNIFDVHNETMAMLFRIGHAKRPSAKSSRLPPQITFR